MGTAEVIKDSDSPNLSDGSPSAESHVFEQITLQQPSFSDNHEKIKSQS